MERRAARPASFLVAVLFCASAAQASPCDWPGTYVWEEAAGARVNGLGVVVDYSIKIKKRNGGLKAVIDEEGFQTDETIVCDAKPVGDALELLFSGYADGKATNKYGVAVYKKGERLLTLRCAGKARRTTTDWGALVTNTKPKSGKVYFKKL